MAFETINETKQVQFLSFYLNSGLSEVRYSDHPVLRCPVLITNWARIGIGKLAYLKVDIGKILGLLPCMSKIPLQGNGMAAIPKIL